MSGTPHRSSSAACMRPVPDGHHELIPDPVTPKVATVHDPGAQTVNGHAAEEQRPLTDQQVQALQVLIQAERAKQVAQVETARLTFDELVAAADLEPPDDEHDPDGTTAYERAQVSSLRSVGEQAIARLDEAAHRLELGTYGDCDSCGASIPFDRLVAVLGTDRCVSCATGRT